MQVVSKLGPPEREVLLFCVPKRFLGESCRWRQNPVSFFFRCASSYLAGEEPGHKRRRCCFFKCGRGIYLNFFWERNNPVTTKTSRKNLIPGKGLFVMKSTQLPYGRMGYVWANLDSCFLPNFCWPQAEICWRWTGLWVFVWIRQSLR